MNPPRIDTGQLLSSGVWRVARALERDGSKVRLVGGCVRNQLLGAPPSDIDMAIDAPPEETVRLLEAAGIGVRTFGAAYGTVMAVPGGGEFVEVTSLRDDIETDGRWPVVRFGADWLADAQRRDFTMNAIYAELDGTILDPVDGLADLRARRVRFVGDPAERIREDHLRALRFFRFHAWYGEGEPDAEGLAAVAEDPAGIFMLSSQRVGAEMRALLRAPDPCGALRAAEGAQVLGTVLRRATAEGMETLIDLERRFGVDPDWPRRWLFLSSSEPADLDGRIVETVVREWSLSRAEAAELAARRGAYLSEVPALELGYRYGAGVAADALLVRACRDGAGESLRGELRDAARGGAGAPPIRARDLLAAGMKPGPDLGAALARAERTWLERDLSPTRSELMAAALKEPA